MPRLSIIIAHHCDQRLEATLLSVLENRPRDCEIIVAHDGTYHDPYELSGEVVFVETNRGSTTVGKMNEALFAACAPAVHVLLDGATVSEGWCEGPLELLAETDVVAVAPIVVSEQKQRAYAGLAPESLIRRGIARYEEGTPNDIAGPLLVAGFYARKTLLALSGWSEAVASDTADVELALNFAKLGLGTIVDDSSVVIAPSSQFNYALDAAATRSLASIAVAHGLAQAGMVQAAKSAAARLLGSLLQPARWSVATAWGRGLLDSALIASLNERIAASRRSQQASQIASPIGLYQPDAAQGRSSSSSSYRRAA